MSDGEARVVFLLDVDNTLLDNDQITLDLKHYLADAFGSDREQRYWEIFEELRSELGYADYLGALQRYRLEHPRDPHMLRVSSYLIDYPFAKRVYPGAFHVIKQLRQWGPTVILSDGDVVFQPRKVERSGLWKAVRGHVLIYVHKEQMLDDVERRYPARKYVMVDDKLRILAAMKQVWGDRLTTVFARQGHYAFDPMAQAAYSAPDITLSGIGELAQCELAALLGLVRSDTRGPTPTVPWLSALGSEARE